MHASCPDCQWQTFCVIGRVDHAHFAPRPLWQRLFALRDDPFTERAGPLLKCARCGSEFYPSGGQLHKFLVGFQPSAQQYAPPVMRTSGADGSKIVNVDFGASDLAASPD